MDVRKFHLFHPLTGRIRKYPLERQLQGQRSSRSDEIDGRESEGTGNCRACLCRAGGIYRSEYGCCDQNKGAFFLNV